MNSAFLKNAKPSRRTAVALTGIAAAVAAGSLAIGSSAASASTAHTTSAAHTASTAHADSKKPTIVLEHGAFADASSWNGVIKRLQQAGYPVIAAANPLRGVGSDAAALRSVIDHVDGPVVLVGHSYGGSVISEAATGESQVKALVYVAAYLPAVGESALELTGKFPGSTLAPNLDAVPFTQSDGSKGTDLYVKTDKFHHQFAADVPTGTANLMAATQRPVTQAALEEKATSAAWKTTPVWDVITTQDLNIPPAAQRYMAKRAHAHSVEVKSSHVAMISHPDTVTHVIEQAARTTVK